VPPEPKTCASCGRTIEWRTKWARSWDDVKYCSDACRRHTVTDADRDIRYDPAEKPGVSNLLTLLSVLGGESIPDLEATFAGRGYGDLKGETADAVVAAFEPVRTRTLEMLDDPAELDRMLAGNAERAAEIAEATLAKVYDRIGFLPRR